MADGIRIQPQPSRLDGASAANRLFIIRDVTRPLRGPQPTCRTCEKPHTCKTYHLRMEADGTRIVSTTVWQHLQRLYDHGGFEIVNAVPDPPTQKLILPTAQIKITPAQF